VTLGASVWTDVGAPVLIVVVGAAVAALWPWLQTRARGRRFEGIIRRELEEVGPYPREPAGRPWWSHLRKRFVHEAIFEPARVSENRDFLLTLDPNVVYEVSQLWAAFDKRDGGQFRHFVGALAENRKLKSPGLSDAAHAWEAIIDEQPPEWRDWAPAGEPIRDELVTAVTEASSSLYLQTQRYWRAARHGVDDEELKRHRDDLNRQYYATREQGTVLEARCSAAFASDVPRLLCHRLMDLLTVRYFDLTEAGGASDRLLEINSGPQHSGLGVEELRRPDLLLAKYHATVEEFVSAAKRESLADAAQR
jgi:hypothetical protein